eukprot:4270671-Pyramimonas_sp.AAC.1
MLPVLARDLGGFQSVHAVTHVAHCKDDAMVGFSCYHSASCGGQRFCPVDGAGLSTDTTVLEGIAW